MKTIFLSILILIISTWANYSYGEIIRTEYKQGIKNTYKLEYEDNGRVFVFNIDSPEDNVHRSSLWPDKITIVGFTGDMDAIVQKHIGPCTKLLRTQEDDSEIRDTFFMSIDIGLDGIIKNIYFAYSSMVLSHIPLSVIEELENELKEKHKLLLKFNPDDLEGVQNIDIVRSYSLYYIKEDYLRRPENPGLEELPSLPLN